MSTTLSVRKPAFNLGKDIFDWFTASRYLNEDSFITRLRYFQITAFSIFFITSFLNFISNLISSYLITAVACILLVLVRYLLDNNYVKAAYYSLLVCINLALIFLTAVEGINSGVFLFFFPAIISFSFLVDLSEKRNVLLTYLICLCSFMIAVVFSPAHSITQEISRDAHESNFFINILSSFSLIGWMSFSLARENKKKQNVLKDKEVFLDTVFNSSLHAEIIVDGESGIISDHNHHASVMFGKGEIDLLIDRPISEIFFDSDEMGKKQVQNRICNTIENWSGDLTCIKLDNTLFSASISAVSFQYNNKRYKKIAIADITETKRILDDLQAAKKRAEELADIKSQFLSHMSHELRTPLNGIIGSTNLLLEDKCLPEQKEQLSVLKFSSEHMLNLINDILDLSKLDAEKIQLESNVIDIPKFINKVTSAFVTQCEEKGILLIIKVDPDLKRPVITDVTRLNQVLTNLLSNAVKFTNKGSVSLVVEGLSLKSDYNQIQFSVIDTGIGISEDNKDKIFEQFIQADVKTTRRYGGTGLGLTISQKLVGLMGGELKVKSKYNKGSNFYFDITVPVNSSKGKKYISDKYLQKDQGKLKGLKVLIAEDNPINMMIASRFLDKWGILYEKACNGVEAVSIFNKDTDFDILLMDLDMPEMDGYGALTAIRKSNPTIPVIAFTAAVFENMKETLINSGFDDFIQKPFRPEELHSKLVAFSEDIIKRA